MGSVRRVSSCEPGRGGERNAPAPAGAELTVFYDGGCPACSREIDVYRRRERGARIAWIDLTDGAAELARHGVDFDAAMRFLHAIGADGTRHVGIDAFIEIWRRVPGFRLLARIAGVPGVRTIAQAGYRQFALRVRPRLRRRCPLPETRNEARS